MLELSGSQWIYRIMGIDNGSNTVGVSIIDYDLRTGISTVIYSRTLTADKTAYDIFSGRLEQRGKLDARIQVIRRFIFEILDEFDPDIVGCESPFSHLHVQSYGVLLTTMNAIDDCVYQYNPTLEFAKVPPGKAKKAVCPPGKYRNDKDQIRQFILDNPDILEADQVNLMLLDEHCIDGIAVAICLALDARENAFV